MSHLQRRKFIGIVCAAVGAVGILGGCGGGTTGGLTGGPVRYGFDFNAGWQGWVADFTDLPLNYESMDFELASRHANLPAPLDTTRKALCLTSHNRSDDLWYFLKRQVTGLRPNTRYEVRFDVEIASDASESAVGIGGGEGTSVVVKAGASATEPSVGTGLRDNIPSRVFNLDKGEQFQGGRDVVILGNIAIPGDQKVYTLKQLNNGGTRFVATTDNSGRLWTFVGTESGFEGLQTLYYTRVDLTLSPV